MNKRIKKLAIKAGLSEMTSKYPDMADLYKGADFELERFAELIVSAVLDEVNERVYDSGDRAWSDELDRKWIELEFGFGELADKQNERTN